MNKKSECEDIVKKLQDLAKNLLDADEPVIAASIAETIERVKLGYSKLNK